MPPIEDERKFVSGIRKDTDRNYYQDPSPSRSKPSVANEQPAQTLDPVQEKLDELHKVLLNSKEDREKARIKCEDRWDKIRVDGARAREERNKQYEKLQRALRRVKEIDDDRRKDDAERAAQEEESYRLLEEELAKHHQDRLQSRTIFQEQLKEGEEQQKDIIAALRKRSTGRK